MPVIRRPSSPWDQFLTKLDEAATHLMRLDCIGGFVVTEFYGMGRRTADLDVIELLPSHSATSLWGLAQLGGPLYREFKVYMHRVGIAAVPESYEDRLIEMFPGAYRQLRLMAVDPYDLVLSKIERNVDKDRADMLFLANKIPLDLELLKKRYSEELRWQLGVPAREDLTLKLWIEMIQESRNQATRK